MVQALAHPSRLGSISRQEQAIRQWKKERWPEVKKNRKEGRIIIFIDEGGLSESLRCRTRYRVATTEVEPRKLNNFFSGSPE